MSTLCFVVNDFETLSTAATTRLWIASAAEHHTVYVCPANGLQLQPDGRVIAMARAGLDGPMAPRDLADIDVVVVRCNPGRNPRPAENGLMLQLLLLAEARGTRVVNRPTGLFRAATKMYLGALPEAARPRTLVTRSRGAVVDFLAALHGPGVLKPIAGTHGIDVFKVSGPDQPDLDDLIAATTRNGPAMVQAFVPEAVDGDCRVHLLDGDLLVVDGVPAVIRRRPPAHDFRSNVHLGGTPERADLTPEIERLIALVGPQLRADGLWHVGLDVIGGVVIEVNAYSPGGLPDLHELTGVDFLPTLTERLLSRSAT